MIIFMFIKNIYFNDFNKIVITFVDEPHLMFSQSIIIIIFYIYIFFSFFNDNICS